MHVIIYRAAASSASWLDVFQVLSAIATAVAAYFSWRAVKQAEELNYKPIIAVGEISYIGKQLSIVIANLSKDGEKFVKDIEVSFPSAGLRRELPGYLAPEDEITVTFENVEKTVWSGNEMEITYISMNDRTHRLKYRMSEDASHASTIHINPTVVDKFRIK